MPYASHCVVGVMELEPSSAFDESNSIRTMHSPAARTTAAVIRKIEAELADSRSTPRVTSERTVKVDSATLLRELDAELANLLMQSFSAQVS